jgi:hypothetical protein
MAKKFDTIQWMTPWFTARFPHITQPDTDGKFAKGDFKTDAIFDEADLPEIEKTLEEAASDQIIAIGTAGMPDFAVFIIADDSSWSGWTSSTGLQPRIPAKGTLSVAAVNDVPVRLAPEKDSDLNIGESLADGTALELISQDPETGNLYVAVTNSDRTGWIDRLHVKVEGADASLVMRPSSSTNITYRFDCNALVPRSHFYDTGNYGAALNEIEPLATPDCPEAEHLLGVMYGKGQGVQRDVVRAYALLLLAYSAGMAPVAGTGAIVPTLGDNPKELEIVEFGAGLTPEQLTMLRNWHTAWPLEVLPTSTKPLERFSRGWSGTDGTGETVYAPVMQLRSFPAHDFFANPFPTRKPPLGGFYAHPPTVYFFAVTVAKPPGCETNPKRRSLSLARSR